jgi:DNA-binding MarR family transcriptional regulator
VTKRQVHFSQTYIFKVHALKSLLDKAFDQALRKYANITLSQFTLLLVISEYPNINQRSVASLLEISPAAISRQVEIGRRNKLLYAKEDSETRGHALVLTETGFAVIERGIAVLEEQVFLIFRDENRQTSLMNHLDLLINHTKGLVTENAVKNKGYLDPIVQRNIHGGELDMSIQIPKARRLYKGDINAAVIQVQKMTGFEITPAWWEKNVGNNGTSESILEKFDKAYERDFGPKIAELAAKKRPG